MNDKSNKILNDVLAFITKYSDENGYPPSVREICSQLGIKSTATAYSYIQKLTDTGLINKSPNKKRSISTKSNSVKVPLIGTVAAGTPIFAVENYEDYFTLPSNYFNGDDLFMLTVKGDSMIEAGIFNGDKIIVKRQSNADNGEIVVALINDSATVKRFYKQSGKIILHPENQMLQDIVLDDVVVLGKVIGLLRAF